MPDSNKVVRYGREEMVQHEEAADGAVTAGSLVERTANGVAELATSAVNSAQVLVAKDLRQAGYTLDDQYSDGADVPHLACSGGGVHLRLAGGTNLATAANATVSEGDKLVSAGGTTPGTVRKLDTSKTGEAEGDAIAVADENIDNSGVGAATPIAVDF